MNQSFTKKRKIVEANEILEFRMLTEQAPAPQQQTQQPVKEVSCDVGKEGVKNVTPQMIEAAPFKGELMGYSFNGVFQGVKYTWNCMSVEGFPGIRGMSQGVIISEYNKNLANSVKQQVPDADPNGSFVGFVSDNKYPKVVVYTTTDKKAKAISF